MTGKRLSEVEADRRREEREARRWMRRNKHHLEPEEPPRHRVRGGDGLHDRVLVGGALLEVGEDVGVVYSESNRFVPIQGTDRELDLESAALGARVNRALATLPARQQELLRAHYIEGLTLSQLARAGESRQAVHERLTWARLAFGRALLAQEDMPIELTEDDL